MQREHRLLERLDAIAAGLRESGTALALIGLGSVGLERERLDAYSDLDFFVIVKPGLKRHYLAHLDWLAAVHPLAYYFLNTADGYKALFADGIFCEFAVFEMDEMQRLPLSGARVLWKDETFDERLCAPMPRQQDDHPLEFHLGEALTNLYIGLMRERRGEKLSGSRFIQVYALDHVIALSRYMESPQGIAPDPFAHERRYEARYPSLARQVGTFMQGYERNVASALAILRCLRQHFAINPEMSKAIEELCVASPGQENEAAE